MQTRNKYVVRSVGTNEIYRSQTTAAKCRELAANAIVAKLELKIENFLDAIEKNFKLSCLPRTQWTNSLLRVGTTKPQRHHRLNFAELCGALPFHHGTTILFFPTVYTPLM
jgi:hypothetical protein